MKVMIGKVIASLRNTPYLNRAPLIGKIRLGRPVLPRNNPIKGKVIDRELDDRYESSTNDGLDGQIDNIAADDKALEAL